MIVSIIKVLIILQLLINDNIVSKCVIYFWNWKVNSFNFYWEKTRLELYECWVNQVTLRTSYEVWIESYELRVKICASQIWEILLIEDRMKKTFTHFIGEVKREKERKIETSVIRTLENLERFIE